MATTPPLFLLAAQGGCAWPGAGTATRTVRKSAASMTAPEVELFKRAFTLLVENGTLDLFVAEHNDHERHRMHEASPDVRALIPHFMPYPGGQRFLPWHRAFLLEMEKAMRAAVREVDGEEAASRVFLPYWDATHEDGMPAWVADFLPRGIHAAAPEGLPEGHPGYGTERYEVVVSRWPGSILLAPSLPRPEHVGTLLQRPDYTRFTRSLEWAPGLVRTPTAPEAAELERAVPRLRLPDPERATLLRALRGGAEGEEEERMLLRALFRLADQGDGSAEAAEVSRFFLVGPHSAIHLWAGGKSPDHPRVRGTATYFHETVADPVFWLLHADVDRVWATWQTRHAGTPDLQGEDALFQPRGGGQTWTLEELLAFRSLPYQYDRLYTV